MIAQSLFTRDRAGGVGPYVAVDSPCLAGAFQKRNLGGGRPSKAIQKIAPERTEPVIS